MVKRAFEAPAWIPDERRPRQWLDGILAGADRLEAVPAHLTGFVREHLALAVARHAARVAGGINRAQRNDLLASVPPGIFTEVKQEVIRRFQDKRS